MALLKFKRSAVPAKVPALNDLALGELAINTYDGKVYTKKDNGTASIVEVGGGGGVTSFNTRTGAVTLSGSDVTTAIGFTPANKAGDTFTGPITVNSGANQVILGSDGAIELTRGAGGAYIDFKDSTAEDFDVRLQASGNQLGIAAAGGLTLNGAGVLTGITSGMVTTALGYTPVNRAGDTMTGDLGMTKGAPAIVFTSTTSGRAASFGMTDGYNMYLNAPTNGVLFLGEFRAPLMRDTDNSAYYINAADTSVLNNLSVNGGTVFRSDWTTRFQSPSDFVDGTLVTTDIPATAWAGDSFVIEITGKSYNQDNPPFKVAAQGYLYNDTIINYSGISYAGNFATYIKVFEEGGVLKFWWPRISYWNSFNVNVMSMDGQTNGTITRNRVTAIGNSTEPTGTKKQQINLIKTLKTGDAAGSISGFNNPTTAPTANTIAYRDAAGDISAREIVLSSGLSAQTPTVLVSMFPTTNQLVRTTPAAVAAAIQGAASGAWGINVTGKANDLNQARYANTDFNTLGATPEVFRAYTNYIPSGGSYNQPTSSGDFKVIQWGGIDGVAGNWGGQIVQNFYDDRMWFRRSQGTTWQAWREFIHSGNVSTYALPIGGGTVSGAILVGPTGGGAYTRFGQGAGDTTYSTISASNGNLHIDSQAGYDLYLNWYSARPVWSEGAAYFAAYYDKNDTAYYLDPFNTGLSLRVNGNMECYARSAAWAEGYRVRVPARSTWGGIRFTRDEGNANGNWAIGFTGIDSTDDLTFWGNLSGAEGMRARLSQAGNLTVYGATTANQSYAQIFYDSNNGAYYIDPESTSNLYRLSSYIAARDVNANWNTGFQNTPAYSYNYHGDLNGGTNAPAGGWWFYESMRHSNASNYWGTQIAWGWEDNANRMLQRNVSGNSFSAWVEYLSTGGRTYNGNLTMTGSIISSSSDVRAPIFYNHPDTAFYANLDSNSRFQTIDVNDTIYSNNWFRSYGDSGWYNQSYAGGIFMQDTTWVRVYNGKALYVPNEIAATGNITAYYSDERLKTKTSGIDNALEKVVGLNGFLYVENDLARSLGYSNEKQQVGLSAQAVQAILPEAVSLAPVDFETLDDGAIISKSGENYLTVDYSRLVPLLIEAIKELSLKVKTLEEKDN
jgi:hypothetical protein